ncbi:MAG: peptide chain release factor aRF-1 [Candidatus Aenigmarchaeota archaeon]|nr:peptide chain release factor aRF-1 [Candidatus Aenigmarchaeota archaeon]
MKKLLEELEAIKGRHTELISLYIPKGFNLQEVLNMLKQEYALTQNVKSRITRKNVLDALEKISNHLRQFKETPPNGLVVFCGNVSPIEGESDIKLWSVEPPEELGVKMYWCDQRFALEPLKEMVREKEIYGLIILDSSGSDIGLLIGKKVVLEKHVDSLVPGKTTKGGWSQQRYARIREEAKLEHLKKTGEEASEVFSKYPDLKGIIIGGPGPLKEKFYEGSFLNYQLQKKVLGVVDTSYLGMQGLEEAVERGQELIREASLVKERQLLQRFFIHLQKEDGLAVYKIEDVVKAIDYGAVEILLVSENFNWVKFKLSCQCGFQTEKAGRKGETFKCPNCGAILTMQEQKELAEILSEKVKEMGGNVEIISTDSREGQALKEIGGIGAILRYRLNY